jgi:hypothetical protein
LIGAFAVTIAIVVACAFMLPQLSSLSFAQSILPYPRAWDRIQRGDSLEAVTATCPDRHSEHFNLNGKGFYHSVHLYGSWRMYVAFDSNDRVESKRLTLRIGTRQLYKQYDYAVVP